MRRPTYEKLSRVYTIRMPIALGEELDRLAELEHNPTSALLRRIITRAITGEEAGAR